MQEMDILISPLDMSHAAEGYPIYSAGHVSCRRGISLCLWWTCLMQDRDILIAPLDMSYAAEGYPIYSTGHVSYRRGISHLLWWTCLMQQRDIRWTCLIQERDIPFAPVDMSQAGDGYPDISAGHVS